MSDTPNNLDLPALEGLGDPYSARADALGCLALRLNRVRDPAAAALIIDMMQRLVLTVPLPKAAEVHEFNRVQNYLEGSNSK